MDQTPPPSRPSLGEEPSNFSNFSTGSLSTLVSSPSSPFSPRAVYQSIVPVPEEEDISYRGAEPEPRQESTGATLAQRTPGFGLGIDVATSRPTSPPRMPVGSKGSPGTPGTLDPFLSPPMDVGEQQHMGGIGYHDDDGRATPALKRSNPSIYQGFAASSENERLHQKDVSSTVERVDSPGRDCECRAKCQKDHPRGNWLSTIILVLAVYSTVFSGIWLALAMIKPRYGQRISNDGKLPPSTASLLFTAFAKSIELSFTTVFVAFLGQVLTRRAFKTSSKGITIADMNMRSWIMQPGTLLTHWENVGISAFSMLGFVALIAALIAMFYTTASDALVTPKLKYGRMESRILYGKVATQYANPDYIKDHCPTPIRKSVDPDYSGSTCVELENAGQAYHNFQQYRSDWKKMIDEGNTTTRPDPVGLLYDNTTVTGSWLGAENMTELSDRYGRIINNITMAMPHAGVFAAARDPINRIRQPDVNLLGEYYIHASVPSPAVNILCAEMSENDLAPMVYTKWPFWNGTEPNVSRWPQDYNITARPSWLNATAVDDVFGFGEKYNRRHPVFPKLPLPYNTILNSTIGYFDSMYLLATSANSSYMLCSFRQSLTPNCSTIYRASLSGGSLQSRCDDPTNDLAYSRSYPNATNGVLSSDWINVAISWATSLSLNAGISDGKASNARLLTQLIPTTRTLAESLPSIAEALAVLAGSTLLASTRDAPFIHFWNYSTTVPTLAVPQYQGFNASLQTQDYASGGTQRWQGIFYVVLALVFITNVFCLGYFLTHNGFVLDFIEPQNMFCLAINSPSNPHLNRSGGDGGGSGPEREHFRIKWFVGRNQDKIYIHEGETQPVEPRRGGGNRRRSRWLGGAWMKIRRGRGRRNENGDENGEGGDGGERGERGEEMMGRPLQKMYRKVSQGSSTLR